MKILMVLFITLFMLGCDTDEAIEEFKSTYLETNTSKIDVVDNSLSDTVDDLTVDDLKVDDANTIYANYLKNDYNSTPPVPTFEF